MWEAQSGKFTTQKKASIEFCLPEFSVTMIVTWECHVNESTIGIYNVILGRDLLTGLGLDIKFSENVIIGVEGP